MPCAAGKKVLGIKFCKSFDGSSVIQLGQCSLRAVATMGAAGGKPTLSLTTVKFHVKKIGACAADGLYGPRCCPAD